MLARAGCNPGSKLSATERQLRATRDRSQSAESQPVRLDRSGWGPGGRRFKSCLPDTRPVGQQRPDGDRNGHEPATRSQDSGLLRRRSTDLSGVAQTVIFGVVCHESVPRIARGTREARRPTSRLARAATIRGAAYSHAATAPGVGASRGHFRFAARSSRYPCVRDA